MSPLEKHTHMAPSARSQRIRSTRSVGSVLRKSPGGRAGGGGARRPLHGQAHGRELVSNPG